MLPFPANRVLDSEGPPTGFSLRNPRFRSMNSSKLGCVFLLLGLFAALPASAGWKRIVDHGSPWSKKRPVRPQTRYIVLHTTEGAERGALYKLSKDGEAHYLVGKDGTVHRIVDRRRIATHAGRSMWEGRQDIDRYAIGIEIAGYHDRSPTRAQLSALKQLLHELQAIYSVPDERVLTHSMVAFGVPNRYHRKRHRGRKRCGMTLASPKMRKAMGLSDRPSKDPDVSAGRLVVGDPQLYANLFPRVAATPPARAAARIAETKPPKKPPAVPKPPEPKPEKAIVASVAPTEGVIGAGRTPWDIAREAYASPKVTYIFPDGTRHRGNEITAWASIPAGTKVLMTPDSAAATPSEAPAVAAKAAAVADTDDEAALDGFAVVGEDRDLTPIAGDEIAADTTIYWFPDGMVRTGAALASSSRWKSRLESPPVGTRVLVGYQFGGYVKPHRPPSVICGNRWNYPSTFYRLPNGEIRSGDQVDAAHIPLNTLVFFRT